MKKILLIILGIFLAFCFLEISFHILSFILELNKHYKSKEYFKNNNEITIVCIGESMTAGQWPRFLNTELQKRNIYNVNVIDAGVGGTNSDFLIKNVVNQAIEKYKPDIIVSMMGLIDDNEDYKKIKSISIKSKLLSFFYFYKFFNTNITQDTVNKETKTDSTANIDIELIKNFQKAIYYYNNKEFDKALEILKKLDFESPIQKNVERHIIYSLELSGKTKELQDYVLKKLNKDIMFNLEETMKVAQTTKNIEIIKKLIELIKKIFNSNDKEVSKQFVMNRLEHIHVLREFLKEFNLRKELKELNEILNNVENKNIKFTANRLNPYSKKAITNYQTLATICKQKNIKLIIMSYPRLPVLPYKLFLKNFDNIYYVDNQEIFEKALKKNLYFDIFENAYAGNFGHCTNFGNQLIAENLANTIKRIIK